MNKLQSYLNLIRFNKPTGTLLLFFPCLVGLLIKPNPNLLAYAILLFLGSFIMRSAGCVINDLWDINIDRHILRTQDRPLANGEVSIFEAFGVLLILLAGGLFVLFNLPVKAIIAGLVGFLVAVFYPLAKRFFIIPQLILGLTFNIGVLVGFLIGYDSFIIVLPAYFALVIWTIIYDTLYAIQDIEGDKKLGLKSAPILFGKNISLALVLLSALVGVLFAWHGILFNKGYRYYLNCLLLVLVLVRLVLWSLKTQNYKKGFDFNVFVGIIISLLVVS